MPFLFTSIVWLFWIRKKGSRSSALQPCIDPTRACIDWPLSRNDQKKGNNVAMLDCNAAKKARAASMRSRNVAPLSCAGPLQEYNEGLQAHNEAL
jgi:hypothetical protein